MPRKAGASIVQRGKSTHRANPSGRVMIPDSRSRFELGATPSDVLMRNRFPSVKMSVINTKPTKGTMYVPHRTIVFPSQKTRRTSNSAAKPLPPHSIYHHPKHPNPTIKPNERALLSPTPSASLTNTPRVKGFASVSRANLVDDLKTAFTGAHGGAKNKKLPKK